MTTALAERPAALTAPTVTTEDVALIKQTVAAGATDAELKLFLFDCARQGVHPLDRLIHFTKRSNRYTPITSIDFMRIRAADTGDCAGIDDAAFTGEPGRDGFLASVTVWRFVQGQRCAFTATARWSEYKPDSAHMWLRMPHTMLGKCAEALALRKGFPRQLSGLYAKEEMDQAMRVGDTDSPGSTPGAAAGSQREAAGVAIGGGIHQTPPQATVIDVTTGETVPLADRPKAPDGYHYLESYEYENSWHHITVRDSGPEAPPSRYKTRLTKIGKVAADAFKAGLPVALDTTPSTEVGGEGFLNKLTLFELPF